MVYQPRNRNVAPSTFAFAAGDVLFYVDDIDSNGRPIAYGREGSVVTARTYYHGRWTLCDDRGRFLKWPTCRAGEYKRRVRSFRSAEVAAAFAIENAIETCE